MTVQGFTEEEFAGHLNWKLWRSVVPYTRPYLKYLLPLVGFSAIMASCDAGLNLAMRKVINTAVAGDRAGLMLGGAGFVALLLIQVCGVFVFIRLAGKASLGTAHDIRRDVFSKLQELQFAYYDTHPVGWLMARATSDCQRLGRLFSWGLMDVTWGLFMMIALASIMLALNWKLALMVFSAVPILLIVSKMFTRIMLLTSRAVRKINSQITAAYNEGITAVRTTKTLVRQESSLREFQQLSNEMYRQSVRNSLQSAVYFPIVMTIGATGAGLALWLGGMSAISGEISLGTMILFINCAYQFFNPVHELARVLTDIQGAQASAERVMGLLTTETEIKDSPEVRSAIAEQARRKQPGLAIDGLPLRIREIRFQNVGFAYKSGQAVLEDFNLTVSTGQTIALVGPTGGGKTTIVSLLARFYEPTSGQILLDGVDYRRRSLHWLQTNLGIVLQTPHLFSGTIRQNIRYGRLDADDEAVAWAARLVNAEDFILRMEKGYDTEVGEGGGRLSTGQKQLVSLARAVLSDPQIFIMDEATSSVDTETERLIQTGIEAVLRKRTSFVVAHRLSTIRSADRILVIDNGSIVEHGNHHQLILHRGRYYELYTNQFTQEHEEQLLGATGKS